MASARNLLSPTPGAHEAATAHARHAVVIGINRYQDPTIRDLRFARADAEAVHAVLTDPELGRFDPENVTRLLDEEATRRSIRSAIGTQLKRRAGEDDTVLIYYAGHGAPENDPRARSADKLEKYLVPHDADHDDLFATGISMDEVQRFFGRIASKRIVFFIDSCYSGGAGGRTFEHPGHQHRASLTDEFLEQLAGEGRLVVTACNVNELSLEVPDLEHGLFTHYLLEGLRGAADADRDGLVTMGELYDYLCENVTRHARRMGGSMRPVQKGSVQGRVYLTRYETEAQKRARRLDGEAQTLFEAGKLDEAGTRWEEVLQQVPGHERAQQGLAEIARRREEARRKREVEERVRQQTLKRRKGVLWRHYQAGTLPLAEYTRGMALLDKSPEDWTETEAAIRKRLLEPLTDEQIPVSLYLESIWLLAPSPQEEGAGAQELEPDSLPEEGSAVEQPPPVMVSPEPEAPAGAEAPPRAAPEPTRAVQEVGAQPAVKEARRTKKAPVPAKPGQSASQPQVEPSPAALPKTLENTLGMRFALIPAGTFEMGSNEGHDDEKPVHRVAISRPFYLGVHVVTQGQWKEVMGGKPSRFEGDDARPVESVSWDDVQDFIRRLNEREGCEACYRLPTEAEWEYACRAGSTTAYGYGDAVKTLGDYAWYNKNAGGQTHPVGQKQPNAWGLYDMHGNVWEWVADWYGAYPSEAVTDPRGPVSGTLRVIRGGSWYYAARYARSADRYFARPGYRNYDLGFRLVRAGP